VATLVLSINNFKPNKMNPDGYAATCICDAEKERARYQRKKKQKVVDENEPPSRQAVGGDASPATAVEEEELDQEEFKDLGVVSLNGFLQTPSRVYPRVTGQNTRGFLPCLRGTCTCTGFRPAKVSTHGYNICRSQVTYRYF
jgi:hypothetical protein